MGLFDGLRSLFKPHSEDAASSDEMRRDMARMLAEFKKLSEENVRLREENRRLKERSQ